MATRVRGRSVAAGILGVLAVVVLLAGTLALWARSTLFSSDKVAGVVSGALAEPEVSAALAQRLTDQVFEAVDIDAALAETLPPALQRLEPAVAGGIQALVQRTFSTALENDEVQQRLSELVRRAHAAAMRLLEGDGLLDAVSTVDGEVTLNLLPLLGRGLVRVQDLGLLSDVTVPELSADGDPAEQIAELEAALDRDLPDDFGQLVVYRSDALAGAQASLESAQQAAALAKRAIWVLLVATVLLFVAAVVLARDRWRAALLVGLGVVVAMVLARTAVDRVIEDAPDLVVQPGAKAALSSILGDFGTSLRRTLGVLLVLAVIVTGVALLRRRWTRADLAIVAAVLTGVTVIGLLGLSIVSLLLGVVLAVAVAVALRTWWTASTDLAATGDQGGMNV